MGSPLIKRLDALYQRAQMVMKVQADHAPFAYIAPWSFMKDECIVKYYPEGTYQEPERITTTLHDGKFTARQRISALQKHFTEHGYLQRQKKSMQRESKMRNMQQESQRKPIPLLSGKSLVTR